MTQTVLKICVASVLIIGMSAAQANYCGQNLIRGIQAFCGKNMSAANNTLIQVGTLAKNVVDCPTFKATNLIKDGKPWVKKFCGQPQNASLTKVELRLNHKKKEVKTPCGCK